MVHVNSKLFFNFSKLEYFCSHPSFPRDDHLLNVHCIAFSTWWCPLSFYSGRKTKFYIFMQTNRILCVHMSRWICSICCRRIWWCSFDTSSYFIYHLDTEFSQSCTSIVSVQMIFWNYATSFWVALFWPIGSLIDSWAQTCS